MGNPRIQARIPDDLKAQIEEEADEREISQSKVARQRIQDSYESEVTDDAAAAAEEMNQQYARPAPVAGLEEAAKRANETALYGSVLALLSLALAVIPTLIPLTPVVTTFASVVSVVVAALGVLNMTTAVIGTLYRAAKIVTAAGGAPTTSTN